MKVFNRTSFPLIAYGVQEKMGRGEEAMIRPGESANVNGPKIKHLRGGVGYIPIFGELTCHNFLDDCDSNKFHVAKGKPIHYRAGKIHVIIRHFEDEDPKKDLLK